MTAAGNLGLDELVKLARDKSRKSRSVPFATINDLYSGEEKFLTEQDRTIMVDIIRRLVGEVKASVRRILSERLAERPDAPRDLVVTLANEEIEVAHPILVKSEVLQDPELIEIVQHRTMEHQVAVAMRPNIREQVSNVLVQPLRNRHRGPLIEEPLMVDSDLTATSDIRPECPYFWRLCLP